MSPRNRLWYGLISKYRYSSATGGGGGEAEDFRPSDLRKTMHFYSTCSSRRELDIPDEMLRAVGMTPCAVGTVSVSA